ncbi:MAG TPA: anti-sigma factor [Pyrinomonadaceae bacterium]|jgi:anti-sigma factor RsiW|nr:anti-sigma factor [Pyrinomonadaceae bacterium]
MREICLDEGILQSYLDGELSLEMTEQVAGHIAACAPCAEMVREAEGELAIFNTAFAPELALPVPSEQLRVRINQAVDALETNAPPQSFQQQADSGWRAWLGAFAATFKTQRAAGFATLIVLVTFGFIFNTVYRSYPGRATVSPEHPFIVSDESGGPIAKVNAPTVSDATPAPAASPAPKTASSPEVLKPIRRSNTSNTGAQYLAVNHKSQRAPVRMNNSLPSNITPEANPALAELPGEKSYLKTIASLTTAIDTNASLTMQPTLRTEYERNLALVNQAISATRPVALRKPGDPAATQFLYSAYQSKIDLLNAIADRQSEAIARR